MVTIRCECKRSSGVGVDAAAPPNSRDVYTCGCGRVNNIVCLAGEWTITDSGQTKEVSPVPAEEPVEAGFVFDASVHHVEHRGGGRWYVMSGEEKVFGPLDKATAKAYGDK